VRERLPDEARSPLLLIYDLEGELFFGAAPELDYYLDQITRETSTGIKCIVLRLRRTRTLTWLPLSTSNGFYAMRIGEV